MKTPRFRTSWAVVAAAAIAIGALVAVAPSAAAPVADPPIITPSSVAPGGSFTVSGGYCDGIVTVTIAGLGLSDETDGGTPPWVIPFDVPADATPGQYTVVSKCSYFDFPDTTLTVTGAATTTTAVATTTTTTTAPATTTTAPAVSAAAVNTTATFTG